MLKRSKAIAKAIKNAGMPKRIYGSAFGDAIVKTMRTLPIQLKINKSLFRLQYKQYSIPKKINNPEITPTP